MPRPAQPAVQIRSAFPFAPPTAPSIPLTASKGVFTFCADSLRHGPTLRPSEPTGLKTSVLNPDHPG
jgi:hypothetical protein